MSTTIQRNPAIESSLPRERTSPATAAPDGTAVPSFIEEYTRALSVMFLTNEIMKPSDPEEGETWNTDGQAW